MYTYGAGSPRTYAGLGETIAVKIYASEEERAKALAEHEKYLEEKAKTEDTRTAREKYEALDWNQFTLKPEPPAPPFPWWGKLAIAGGAVAAGLLVLRGLTRRRAA